MFQGRLTTIARGVRLTLKSGEAEAHVDLVTDGAEWWRADEETQKVRRRWLSRESAVGEAIEDNLWWLAKGA